MNDRKIRQKGARMVLNEITIQCVKEKQKCRKSALSDLGK